MSASDITADDFQEQREKLLQLAAPIMSLMAVNNFQEQGEVLVGSSYPLLDLPFRENGCTRGLDVCPVALFS